MAVTVVSRFRRVTRAHPHYADLAVGFVAAGLLVATWLIGRETEPSSLNEPASALAIGISSVMTLLAVALRSFIRG